MMILKGILAVIITLILVVGIHEAGHALAAYFFRVKIKKISIGFGRPLITWQTKNGCQWVWALWPLGGYIALENTRTGAVEEDQYRYCFDKQPIWVRLVILFSGIFANLVTAWLALFFIFYLGITQRVPQVLQVEPNSIAALAGVAAGDKIIAMGEREVASWQEVGMQFIIFLGKKVPLQLRSSHPNKIRTVTLDLSQLKFTGQKRTLLDAIGVVPNRLSRMQVVGGLSLMDSIQETNEATLYLLYFFLMTLKQLFSGLIPFSVLLGPVGWFTLSVTSLLQGLMSFLLFIANFSLAVALINLLPIPGLDGGSMIYCLIEKIRGKPMSIALEVLLYQLTLIVFFLLLVQLLINDFSKFFFIDS